MQQNERTDSGARREEASLCCVVFCATSRRATPLSTVLVAFLRVRVAFRSQRFLEILCYLIFVFVGVASLTERDDGVAAGGGVGVASRVRVLSGRVIIKSAAAVVRFMVRGLGIYGVSCVT